MSDRDTPRRIALARVTTEVGNGNGHDARADDDDRYAAKGDDDRPFIPPRSPAEIAANAAVQSLAASLKASEWAGEAMGAANRAEDASRATQDEVRGLTERHAALEKTVNDVAKAVGARRTFSGALRVSLPPTSMPVEIKTTPSATGEHQRISQHELDRLAGIIASLEAESRERAAEARLAEAEERGAREALAAVEAEKAEMQLAEDRRHKRNENARNLILAGIAMIGATYGAIEWALAHIH